MPKLSKALQNDLELAAESILPGDTEHFICPVCSGGSSKEESFYITKLEDGAVLFICHRASCGLKGRISGGVGEVEKRVPKISKVKTKKEISIEKLLASILPEPPDSVIKYVQDKYNINLVYNFVRWTESFSPTAPDSSTETSGRIALPIFDELFTLKGYDLKDVYKTQAPKSLIMKDPEYKGGAWYPVTIENTSSLIIVEDLLSAIAVRSFGIDALALLGTHITDECAEQINNQKYKRVVVALDNDATSKATSIVVSGTLNNSHLLILPKDIKDMSLEERATLLEPYKAP